jgi:hypothetical protein
MDYYYLNKDTSQNPNHDHEVHKQGCIWMPAPLNREYLGYCINGIEAVKRANQMGYYNVDGCATCCPEAHKS